MEVIRSPLYPIIEETISDDIVAFVEENINKISFTIKSVPKGIDPAHISAGIIGNYRHYHETYISDPNSEWGIGTINCQDKEIAFNNKKVAFFNQRDAYVYLTPDYTYIRENYQQVLEEFLNKGYKLI